MVAAELAAWDTRKAADKTVDQRACISEYIALPAETDALEAEAWAWAEPRSLAGDLVRTACNYSDTLGDEWPRVLEPTIFRPLAADLVAYDAAAYVAVADAVEEAFGAADGVAAAHINEVVASDSPNEEAVDRNQRVQPSCDEAVPSSAEVHWNHTTPLHELGAGEDAKQLMASKDQLVLWVAAANHQLVRS
jgi:hypothetical protein